MLLPLMNEQAKPDVGASEPTASNPPADLNPAGQIRMAVVGIEKINEKLEHLSKPPTVRIADLVALGGLIITIFAFVTGAFALGGRIEASEERLARADERILSSLDRLEDDLGDLRTRAAVLEDRQNQENPSD